MTVPEQATTVTTTDDVELAAWLSVPDDARGVMVLCHGLTTDHTDNGALTRVRDRAVRRGLAVARFDFRVHGASGGTNQNFRLAGMRLDVEAVLARVDEELGTALPRVIVGLSFGGAAAVHAAAIDPSCAGLVLWYPVLDYEHNYGVDSPVAFSAQMRRDVTPDDPDWAAMKIAVADFLMHTELVEEFETDQTMQTLASLRVPVLGLHGSRDRFVDPEPLRYLSSRHAHIKMRTLHGAGHGYFLWLPAAVRQTVAFAERAVAQAGRR